MRTVDPEKWYKKRKRLSPWNSLVGKEQSSLEMRLRASLWDTTREYWTNSSLGIQRRVADSTMSTFERRIHALLLTVCFFWAMYQMEVRWSAVHDAPAHVVMRHTAHHSIRQVPFPAVALCSNNIIAREPLDKYTHYLHSRSNSNYSWDFIRENLLQFGSLLTMEQPKLDVAFMEFLVRTDNSFNVTKIMAMFSTPCDIMLKRCSWRGKIVACDRLFDIRATPLGYCCVFNSRYYNVDKNRPPRYLDMVGWDYGLSVIVYERADEFAYIRRPSVGVDVLLFDGSEYPILEGGGVRMYPMQQNTSAFLSLSTTTQLPTDSAAGCRRRERYAWCLTECRRRTLAALCGCHLHTLPPVRTGRMSTCSLIDLPCLNKHREKLIYYHPRDSFTPALEEELQNGQWCQRCEPDCARYLYSATVSMGRYNHNLVHKLFRRPITYNKMILNATTIRVFYTSEHQNLYFIDASDNWYESFAALSSVWCGLTATTLIMMSEIVFYYTIRWAHHYKRRRRDARRLNRLRATYHT